MRTITTPVPCPPGLLRHLSTAGAAALALAVLTAACSAPADDGDAPPPVRPERTGLLDRSSTLRGVEVVEAEEGPWHVRRIAGGAVAGAGTVPGAVWNDGIGGDVRARPESTLEGPATGASASPPPSAVVPVASSEAVRSVVAGEDRFAAAEPAPTDGEVRRRDELRHGDRGGGVAPPASPLRAGSTDDNLDHAAFVKYLAEHAEPLKGRAQDLDVADRRSVRVVDAGGAPVPGAEVALVDEDRDQIVWRGTTYGDGSFPFFPSLLPKGTGSTFLLEVRAGGRFLRHHWNGRGDECVVQLPKGGATAGTEADGKTGGETDGATDGKADEVILDVVFLIDTTGSMGDEIEQIKQSLLGVTQKLRNLDREFDLRYGAVLYRDIADAYVTKTHPFTGDLEAFDKALKTIAADGGGDTPESLNQGLAVAVDGMEWRKGAAKLVFLIADAPPHLDYQNDVPYGKSLEAAVARGIKVHSVAASGLDDAGSYVFRQIAHFTRGKFIFIEYGGDVKKTAEGHGVAGPVKGNNLDDILFEQIRDEVAHWGRS